MDHLAAPGVETPERRGVSVTCASCFLPPSRFMMVSNVLSFFIASSASDQALTVAAGVAVAGVAAHAIASVIQQKKAGHDDQDE